MVIGCSLSPERKKPDPCRFVRITKVIQFVVLAFLCLLSFIGVTIAQNILDDRHAQVVVYWQVGDIVSYDVRREKTGDQSGTLSFQLTIRVLEASDTGYLLDCQYSHLELHGPMPTNLSERELHNRIMTAMDGLRVLARASELGEFIGVVNKEEVQEHADNLFREMLGTIPYPELRERLEQTFKAVIIPEIMEASAVQDVGILLFPFGVSLTLNEKVSGQTELPNPLGGPPIPAKQVVELTQLDPRTAKATIVIDQRMDPESFGEMMETLVQRMGIDMEAEDRSELRKVLQSMKVEHHMLFELDLHGAWADRVVVECIAASDEMQMLRSDKRTYQRR